MDSIILAGGYAKRLYPLTLDKAKPLLEVAGRPVLSYIFDRLRELYSEYKGKCYLTISKKFENDFREFLKYENINFPLEVIVEEAMLGTDAALNDFFNTHDFSKEGVLVIAGDGIFSFDLRDFVGYYKKHPQRSLVALYDVKDKEKAKPHACIELAPKEDEYGRKITRYEEKPEEPRTTVVNATCFIFNPTDLERIRESYPEGSGHLDWLIMDQKIALNGIVFEGYWFDIGNLDSLKEAESFLQKRKNR